MAKSSPPKGSHKNERLEVDEFVNSTGNAGWSHMVPSSIEEDQYKLGRK
jgi:hypothetical protein